MAIKNIPLSRLETDLRQTLTECAESGETLGLAEREPEHVVGAVGGRLIALAPQAIGRDPGPRPGEKRGPPPKCGLQGVESHHGLVDRGGLGLGLAPLPRERGFLTRFLGVSVGGG